MTDLASKVVLVTGATDGLGQGIVRALAHERATVLVHGRDAGRAEALAAELRAAGAPVRVYLADLASLAEVRALAGAVLVGEPRLDVLVCNAGIGSTVPTPERVESRDGIELRFAVNYLSHYLLTRALLPRLRASAPARIVNVASAGQTAIDFDDPMITRGYSGARAYCQSKLAQILSTFDLAEETAGTGVTVNALHPATFMPTKIVANPISTIDEGVQATMRLICDPSLTGMSGKYFNGMHEATAEAQAYDAEARARLRALSDQLIAAAGSRPPG
ncbi:MAG TPA: SDR family NAD(P)-dependent oxidoreductase [Kofleriaceae bacterium]|nr:SDR family NAD(P)-dependent oxidoreductase [Kofleriaceae bacterium]